MSNGRAWTRKQQGEMVRYVRRQRRQRHMRAAGGRESGRKQRAAPSWQIQRERRKQAWHTRNKQARRRQW